MSADTAKEQLGDEAIHRSGRSYLRLIDAVFDPAPHVASAVGTFFAGAATTLRASDYADAYPIATVAFEVANTRTSRCPCRSAPPVPGTVG